ncbi:MAG: SDR family oxidoreductase [Bacillota bacterium]|nr:SDR family oxidoreductase [Bacillota bacterium]
MTMNKTVLITGASRGIGAQTARLFSENGFNVVINYYKSESAAFALRDEIINKGGNAIAICCDVANEAEVTQMFNTANKVFGQLDILVNNAGIAMQKLITETSFDEYRRIINVNLDGVFNCCKAVLPQMISRKSGIIINVSSMWGQTGASCEVAYSAAKAGVIGLTKALAKEVGLSGIRVNCVAPGVIATDMLGDLEEQTLEELKSETPLNCLGTPNDIAEAILFLSSDKAKFITGQVISVNGGFV